MFQIRQLVAIQIQFFFNFFALLTLKDFTIYTLQYITRTKKIEQITQMIKGKMCAVAN